MKSSIHPSTLCAQLSSTVLGIATVLVLSSALSFPQSRIIRPPSQTNSQVPAKRPPVTTLRASESTNGSRVAVSSDQSLTNYEAYRRGDRFYVRIPAAEVPRAESTRGRGFADVKAQRSGDSTVVSFRLQPGATAHVEQRANRLEVVFTVPGGSTDASTSAPGDTSGPRPNPTATPKASASNRASNPSSGSSNSSAPANRNSTLAAKPTATPKPAGLRTATPTPKAAAISSPTNQGTSPTQPLSRGSFWSQAKQKVNYWILLAQLNPVPVAIGAAVLLLLVGLLILQRRRAKGTRGTRRHRADSGKTNAGAEASPTQQPAVSTADSTVKSSVPVEAAAAGIAADAVSSKEVVEEPKPAKPEVPPVSAGADAVRRERVSRVSDEVKNVMAGGEYNETVIGSDDGETRKLVGAELLAALVGRSIPRRERARAAFIKHGYFDDATRDLRIADSANERAAAARRLSFVREREATPHLIGALDDPAPDVRRAAVEALMDLRDPSAIGPLNSLLQTENDRKVPRTLIKHAIDACATTSADEAAPAVTSIPSAPAVHPSSLATDSEREVIEI
ncbi:MAG: HEAT repeat domain-containing protein [Acidobacteriota bacterium]